ncbi:MAG: hypothetical protein LUH53_03915 [Lachnospiraceae bacterium]|nr:hypothetical protein [Lachnospiraceae bacterium]
MNKDLTYGDPEKVLWQFCLPLFGSIIFQQLYNIADSLGAGKRSRVKDGFRAGVKMVWMLSVPIVLLYLVFGKYLLYLFLDEPTAVALQTGITYLRILSPFYFIVSVKLVADGILKGASLMKLFMISTFTDLILRVSLAVLLSGTALGSTGIWCAWPIGWVIGTALSVVFYRKSTSGEVAA